MKGGFYDELRKYLFIMSGKKAAKEHFERHCLNSLLMINEWKISSMYMDGTMAESNSGQNEWYFFQRHFGLKDILVRSTFAYDI